MTVHAGWCGFELVGNAFKITSEIADIDDLEKVLSSRFLRFSLDSQSAESPCQQQVSVVRQHSQQQSSLWWRKQHDVHWRCYFAGLCYECAVRLLRRKRNWPFPPFKLMYICIYIYIHSTGSEPFLCCQRRCKSECDSPPKSYCAFLALCVARTFLFAGLKMMENRRSKPEWPSRSFLFASSSFHPAAGFLTRTKTVLMAIFCHRGQIL